MPYGSLELTCSPAESGQWVYLATVGADASGVNPAAAMTDLGVPEQGWKDTRAVQG